MVVSESPTLIKVEEIDRFLGDELADLFHVENMLVKALPKLTAGATSPELKELFESHFADTRIQVKRLEKMFAALDRPAREKKCEGMMGLLVECQHLLTRAKPSLAVDQALICAARKVEVFEIVAYQSLANWADLCGYTAVRDLALETFHEEEIMNEALKHLSVGESIRSRSPAPRRAKARDAVAAL